MIFEKIRERLQEALSNVNVNRITDNIIKDKPKELGQIKAYNRALDIINQAEAEYNNGWISVEDRLPENMQGCLVTARIYFIPDHVDEPDNYIGVDFDTYSSRFGWFSGNEVIAWQPLPEPYTKGE